MSTAHRLVCIFPQYMMSGEWKGNEVAIRVANDNAITEEGLEFIEEAISAMKYALLRFLIHVGWILTHILFSTVGSFHIQIY